MDQHYHRHSTDGFHSSCKEDPNRSGLLYAGTETGVYVSFNAGEQWQLPQLNLPAVPITDLAVHKRDKDLIVATQVGLLGSR